MPNTLRQCVKGPRRATLTAAQKALEEGETG